MNNRKCLIHGIFLFLRRWAKVVFSLALDNVRVSSYDFSKDPENVEDIKNAFLHYPNLTRLDLGSNSISSIHRGSFYSLSGLTELNLENNKVSSLERQTFSGVTSILSLHGNQLCDVKQGTVDGLIHLTRLRISGNALTVLHRGLFVGLRSLETLYLENNQITSMSRNIFKGLRHLHDLDDNPWDCDCRILCLKRWFEKSSNRRLSVSVRCSQPETRRGQYLGAISSALIQSNNSMCSDALPHVNSGAIAFASNTWLSELNIEEIQTHKTATPVVIIKNLSGPEPHTIILYFIATNTLVIIVVLILFGIYSLHTEETLEQYSADVLSEQKYLLCYVCWDTNVLS
uniref:LRRCT domain-containing protein n=1 Tax=Oncorhynchus mykiss TaxID=8022 RepID=A0A8C7REQ3_ONCMY